MNFNKPEKIRTIDIYVPIYTPDKSSLILKLSANFNFGGKTQ